MIVDTNVLFSFFKSDSFTRKIISSESLQLKAPDLAKFELLKCSNELISKAKISMDELKFIISGLDLFIDFVPIKEYKDFLGDALKLAKNLSKDEYWQYAGDIDFFALAIKEKDSIWSNDRLFKKISGFKVFNTEELTEHLKSRDLL